MAEIPLLQSYIVLSTASIHSYERDLDVKIKWSFGTLVKLNKQMSA